MQKIDYNEILDSLPSSVFLVDSGNIIRYYNRSFFEYFREKQKELGLGESIGKSINCASFMDGLCGKGKDCELCMINRMIKDMSEAKGGPQKRIFEKWLKCEGGIKCYRMSLSVVPVQGGGYCCVIDDITEIQDSLSHMNKKMRMDLNRARLIQTQLLPSFDKLQPLAEFVYYYQQSYLVGGDLFDLFKIDEKRFGGYIADVSGMGVSGGMLTMYLHDNYPKSVFPPSKALSKFAEKFNSLRSTEESYITMLAFSVDTEKKILRYCNAGHAVPALLKKEGSLQKLDSNGNTISNWYQGASFNDIETGYEPGDVLILFTDGLPDTRNIEGDLFTFERVCDVAKRAPRAMKDILKAMEVDFFEFCEGVLPSDSDDITVLVITLK